MTEIYLVRHGQSEANVQHIWGGDYHLTAEGKRQAEAARKYLPTNPVAVYASTKIRTQETAHIVYPQSRIFTDYEFDEINFGIYENKVVSMDANIRELLKDPTATDIFEGGDNMQQRAIAAIHELGNIATIFSGQKVVIFTSETILRCILAQMEYEKTKVFSIPGHIENCDFRKINM